MTLSERRTVLVWLMLILAVVALLLIGLPFANFQLQGVSASYGFGRPGACELSGAQGHFISGTYLHGDAEGAAANASSNFVLGPGEQKYDICVGELTDDYVGIDHAGLHRYVNRGALVWVSPKGS